MEEVSMVQLNGVSADDVDDPSEAKGDTAHPEDIDVSAQEMSFYSSVVSEGENVSSLKKDVEDKKKPKQLNEESAMAVYQNQIGQLGAQEGETVSADSQPAPAAADNSKDQKAAETEDKGAADSSPSGVPAPRPGAKTDTEQTKEEEDQMKAYAETLNTKKWARAELIDGTKQQKKSPEAQVNVTNLSQQEYEKLFHEATVEANSEVDGKSFQELQDQDLKESEKQEQHKEAEEATAKAESNPEPLNKEGSQVNGENPESMGDVNMVQAMSYTDQATDQAQSYNEEQVKETESKKNESKGKDHEPLPDPQSSSHKASFYEQILLKSLDADPQAVKTLAALKVETVNKSQKDSAKAQQKEDKNLYEQLWERNNPEAAKTLVIETKEEKQRNEFKKLKESEEIQMDALMSLNDGGGQ